MHSEAKLNECSGLEMASEVKKFRCITLRARMKICKVLGGRERQKWPQRKRDLGSYRFRRHQCRPFDPVEHRGHTPSTPTVVRPTTFGKQPAATTDCVENYLALRSKTPKRTLRRIPAIINDIHDIRARNASLEPSNERLRNEEGRI